MIFWKNFVFTCYSLQRPDGYLCKRQWSMSQRNRQRPASRVFSLFPRSALIVPHIFGSDASIAFMGL